LGIALNALKTARAELSYRKGLDLWIELQNENALWAKKLNKPQEVAENISKNPCGSSKYKMTDSTHWNEVASQPASRRKHKAWVSEALRAKPQSKTVKGFQPPKGRQP